MEVHPAVPHRYLQPPIVEALCEIQYKSNKPWDLTFHGLFYEKIRDRFPKTKNVQSLDFQLRGTPKGIESKFEPGPPRSQFLTQDERALLQLGPNLLAANHLVPYPSWEKFKPMILDACRTYDDIAGPTGFERIGLRYVNRLDFAQETILMEDYLLFYPHLPPKLPQTHEAFVARVELPEQADRDRLLITTANAAAEKTGGASILLDLDYVMVKPEGIQKTELGDWIEHAHATIEGAFEACITDKSREMFGVKS